MKDFTHLHVHSHYSLMDGLNTPEELMVAAKDAGQTSIAITDHGSLSGHRDLQKAAVTHGIKPILGVEAYISPTDRFDKSGKFSKSEGSSTDVYNHIILLAKNQNGLRNIQKMSDVAWSEGFYYKPRIDWDTLNQYGDDIIVLSGCLNGFLAKSIERGDAWQAEMVAQVFKDRWGDDYYIEVQAHNPKHINDGLFWVADRTGVTPTVTSDCHFAREEDRDLQEVMLILNTSAKADKDKSYDDYLYYRETIERLNAIWGDAESRMSFQEWNLFVEERGDLAAQMTSKGYEREDIYESTLDIRDKVGEYEYYEGLDLLPCDFDDPHAELERRCLEGLKVRGCTTPEYYDRLREELKVIRDKNFSNYFLVVEDMCRYAHDNDIMIGPGRGSAAGSLVCYSLEITDVDPLEWGLLFFRFLNPERNDFPDIDTDFEDSRRDEVKDYLRRRWPHVANIATFGFFKDKGVVRDVSRVFRVPLGEVNSMLKEVEDWDDFIESTHEKVVKFRQKYPEVQTHGERLRGRIRQAGVHAAGVVVSKEPIDNYVPVETREDKNDKANDRKPTVAYDMTVCEEIGLIKLDVLGLKTLSVIHDTVRYVKANQGIDIDLKALSLDDQSVLQEFAEGHTVGVFQAEASAYTRLLKKMGVDDFNDLVASNALVRPGAMNTVGAAYMARKNGDEAITYDHPLLEPFLKDTYGVIIYQEAVMQAAVHLGGLTWAEADKMRKIIGKKKDPALFEQFKDKFIDGAVEKGMTREAALNLFHDFEAHAGYSFNKSHAVCYSLISYWTMWLKHYYPREYIAAMFKHEGEKKKRVDIFIEANRLGIQVDLPHVNKSDFYAKVVDNKRIRLGLTDIKYISVAAATALVKHRPYADYDHLCEAWKTKRSGITKRHIGALDAVGAAALNGNPPTGEESVNYFEYLNMPKFQHYDWPDHILDILDSVDEFEEDGTYIFLGMVTEIKKGPGWTRAEIVDETGTAGVFLPKNSKAETGELYFMLCSNNRLTRVIPAQQAWDEIGIWSNDAFVRFITYPNLRELGVKPGFNYIVSFDTMKTRKGDPMGIIVIANSEKKMRRVLSFKSTYWRSHELCEPGSVVAIKMRKIDGEAFALKTCEVANEVQ